MAYLNPPQPIHIKKSHKGRFTAWAKAHGFNSVQTAASHVIANKHMFPAHVVQMANFAHNAAGFNHGDSESLSEEKTDTSEL